MGEYQSSSRHARGDLNGRASSSSTVLTVVSTKAERGTRRDHVAPDSTTRRRHVLEMLFGVIAVPALIALATGSSTAWWVFVGMLPLFGVYLAVVLYARRVRAEPRSTLPSSAARERPVGVWKMFSQAPARNWTRSALSRMR